MPRGASWELSTPCPLYKGEESERYERSQGRVKESENVQK